MVKPRARSLAIQVPVGAVYQCCRTIDDSVDPLLGDTIPRGLRRTVTGEITNTLFETEESYFGMTVRKRFELRTLGGGLRSSSP